jgi:hypothetical protein
MVESAQAGVVLVVLTLTQYRLVFISLAMSSIEPCHALVSIVIDPFIVSR